MGLTAADKSSGTVDIAVADGQHETPVDSSRERAVGAAPQACHFDRALCLKIDRHLLVPFVFLNFLSLMGRTNIGAGLIQKLPQDLHLGPMEVFLCISIPVVPLILLEIPSNLLMRALEKNYGLGYMKYLSAITILLGVVTLGQAFDQTYGAMLATRFLVGVFDAGLIPGAVYVCSLYYPGQHLQWRLSMLMVANISSNIVSNILAYAIAQIDSANGYHGWRWIFIIEGCLTTAIGLICCFSTASRPEKARFLTEDEKGAIAAAMLAESVPSAGLAAEWASFLSNPLNYVWASLYVFTCTTAYSVAIFAPSFVQAFNPTFTVPQVQGQVVPIFVVSAAACLLAAWGADRLDHRSGFALAGYLATIVGYAILRLPRVVSTPVTMLALYLVGIGVYVALPMIWTMTLVNLPTPFQRAIGCGFVVGVGNVAGFVSAWIFRTSQAPRYRAGMQDGLIMTIVAAAMLAGAWAYMVGQNRRAGKGELHSDGTSDPEKNGVGVGTLGRRAPWKYRP